jgi:topoisomerase-4 subunit A
MCSPAGRSDELLVAKTSGYGFVCTYGDLLVATEGRQSLSESVEDGATILPPVWLAGKDHLAALSEDGRLLGLSRATR